MAPPSRKPDVLALLPSLDAINFSNWRPGRLGTIQSFINGTGMREQAIRRHLRALKAEGQAHIGGWIRTVGGPTPVWVAGPGEDKPIPKTKTYAQYCRKFRQRVKKAVTRARQGQDYDYRYSRHVLRALAHDTAQRTRINPQNWFSPLGAL